MLIKIKIKCCINYGKSQDLILCLGISIIVACVIFLYKANSKRDGIFLRGPDAFFMDALAITSGDSEFFLIFDFFINERGEQMTPLFSLNFEEETKAPDITQIFSFSFYFAWFAGSLIIIAGLLAYILSLRLNLESGDTTIFAALTIGLLFDKNKIQTKAKRPKGSSFKS